MDTTEDTPRQEAVEAANSILREFAARTGLSDERVPPRRYLWTDAFAVCTFLALHRAGEPGALDSARRLVDQVHGTLGRHRTGGPRRGPPPGWISGLDEDEGRAHPTAGGLRIGKPLPERGPDEPWDERLEWDRDGQYFHYLTRWMHALGQLARTTGDERPLRQAVELARAAHAGFTFARPGGAGLRMAWKMSVDLSRPLVPSMGAHDPLDGLLTFLSLREQARRAGWRAADVGLDTAVEDMRAMCVGVDWATADPLGLGGLLVDALRLQRLLSVSPEDAALLPALVDSAAAGLAALARTGGLKGPVPRRLAFRELGLAIGLHAVPRLASLRPTARVEALLVWVPLAGAIEEVWRDPEHQTAASWQEHLDINAVMLATSLVPDGYLDA